MLPALPPPFPEPLILSHFPSLLPPSLLLQDMVVCLIFLLTAAITHSFSVPPVTSLLFPNASLTGELKANLLKHMLLKQTQLSHSSSRQPLRNFHYIYSERYILVSTKLSCPPSTSSSPLFPPHEFPQSKGFGAAVVRQQIKSSLGMKAIEVQF